jgi:hypothetical protein
VISVQTLAIAIPLSFLVLFHIIRIARNAPVGTQLENNEYSPPGEMDTVEYGEIPRKRYAFAVADLLPTLGRWGTGMSMFGIFHFMTSTYLLVNFVILFYIFKAGVIEAGIGALGVAIVWLLLPLFEVEEYSQLMEQGKRPRSIDFHITGLLPELLSILTVGALYPSFAV